MVERALEREVLRRSYSIIDMVQNEIGVDVLGVSECVRRQWPVVVESRQWDEIFPTAEINIEVEANIINTGELT